MRFRNQYIVTDSVLELPDSFKRVPFNNLRVYANHPLRVSLGRCNDVEVLLLGYVIDPLSPLRTDEQVTEALAAKGETKDKFFRAIQGLSGRFVVLYKNPTDFIAMGDACGQRQLYYSHLDGNRALTSSPRLFTDTIGKGPVISDEMREFMSLEKFEEEEHALYSDESVDARLFKVLPNHYLDLQQMVTHRIPIFVDDLIAEKDIVEYTARVVEGGIEGLHARFEVIQPLTAGWDSRKLLACSRKFKDDTKYYVFDLSQNTGSSTDVAVSGRLASKLGLNFQVIKPDHPDETFANIYSQEQIVCRMSKIQDNYYLYRQHAGGNVARISGVASAIIKSYFGHTDGRVSPEMLQAFTFYPPNNAVVRRGVERWFSKAESYCKDYGLRILDLFHWEEKEGNWGALCAFEQDIAVEEFWPQANRNLLVSTLRLSPKERCSPKCRLYSKVINLCWPEAMAEPINPATRFKRLKRLIKQNSKLRYYNLKLMQFVERTTGQLRES